jgi:hypothetical protein
MTVPSPGDTDLAPRLFHKFPEGINEICPRPFSPNHRPVHDLRHIPSIQTFPAIYTAIIAAILVLHFGCLGKNIFRSQYDCRSQQKTHPSQALTTYSTPEETVRKRGLVSSLPLPFRSVPAN